MLRNTLHLETVSCFFTSPPLRCAAFGKDTLLCSRWLLQATRAGFSDRWHEILQVTAGKQRFFISRVIFLHNIMLKKQTSKSQPVRLSLSAWMQEVGLFLAPDCAQMFYRRHCDGSLCPMLVFEAGVRLSF